MHFRASTSKTFLHRNRLFLWIASCFHNKKPPVSGVTRRWPEGNVEKPRKFWAKRRIFGTFAQTYGVYQMSEAGRVQPKTGPRSVAYMSLSDTLSATQLTTLISIETGYLTSSGMTAQQTQEAVDEAPVAGGPLSEDATDIGNISDAWMKPDANLSVNVDMDANTITLDGTVTLTGTTLNDFTGSPWFFTNAEGNISNR